ncbi:capZ-interacting protein-like isoform X1 [Solea senegalensis]|uniref:CapZ-interacting protein-like isoform X1 n=1 Tax=Solea senegalensis TaxID=28829 RepID=A0AAV6SKA8_SOLSE|nr:duboraya isoform X2 [Solea senegalensis]KAG7516912.1 capZ-interacting protein-like isoform X1 [Solea senegalensis]
MEEEAPPRRSVAELAGRFRDSAPAQEDAAGQQTEKPVRRRPPHSLQLPKTHGDEHETPDVTSPAKSKRNSALIEKLQASLALSPSAQLPSPKSPGFRLLPPSFPLPSPGATVTTVTTSSTPTPTTPVPDSPITEEEGPTSFEAPPTVVEGSILSSINKSRARHSIRRRPPSRRHKKSSSGEEVSVDSGTEGGGDQEDVFKTDDSMCPEKKTIHKNDESKTETKAEEEKKEEGDRSPSGGEEKEQVQEEEEQVQQEEQEESSGK